jgi:hypothetical protein
LHPKAWQKLGVGLRVSVCIGRELALNPATSKEVAQRKSKCVQ